MDKDEEYIIRENDPDVVRCERCLGSGEIDSGGHEVFVCHVCEGSGLLKAD